MENPATWGRAERVVDEALRKHAEMMAKHYCGLSDVRMVTDALRAAGLLKKEHQHAFIDCDHDWENVWHDAGCFWMCKQCGITVSNDPDYQAIKDYFDLPLLRKGKLKISERKCQTCQHREKVE